MAIFIDLPHSSGILKELLTPPGPRARRRHDVHDEEQRLRKVLQDLTDAEENSRGTKRRSQ